MEKRKILLLRYLLNNCDSGYKVLDVSKIFFSIKVYRDNFEELSSDIEFMSQRKYIDVKYLDEKSICVSMLDNSHILQENIKSDKAVNRKYMISVLINMVLSGVMAFVGAFLAIIITR
jgi:hypothetical protein